MPATRPFNQRPPDRGGEPTANQKMPEAVRPLVEVRHRQIGKYRGWILGPTSPDRRMGKQASVTPRVAFSQLFDGHSRGSKHDVRRVVLRPCLVQEPSLTFHLHKERSAGVGSEDVE